MNLETIRWRRTLGTLAAVTSLGAVVGSVQLVTDTFTPPVSDLSRLGLRSWVLPGIWLAASVALPCGLVTVLAWRRSRRLGAAAVAAGLLLAVELAVQIPFVGLDPLQAVMGTVAVLLVGFGMAAHGNATGPRDRAAKYVESPS
ncbi:hypothetical protein [Nocardioides pelophilus]|uniref:hypothetical protein n=1 Tax=Nocardioides pelophilus TaxID=2172019 RepID=UPI0016049CAD|nr:hypothetical protein [Nocardioides pelophilus]